MNHKRKRPKNRRGGCLLCKPQKMNHFKLSEREKFHVYRKRQAADSEISEHACK